MSTPLKLKSSKLFVRDQNISPIIDTSGISKTTTNNADSKDVDYGPSFEKLSESETWPEQEDFVPNASSISHMKLRKFVVFESMLIYCFAKLNVKDVDCNLRKWKKPYLEQVSI